MKRAESYYTMAADMRREIANVLFNPTVVTNAIHEVAALGHRSYRITQDDPFDLSDTDAARALEVWLDNEEFRYVWRPTFIEVDPYRPEQVTEYPELVIYW
jgi:hypothetical protein